MTQLLTATPDLPSGAVRERLLGKALELFTAKGYAATSVREIVAAAGITKPVLYYYFGSKEGLYLEIMRSTYARFGERLNLLAAAPGKAGQRILHFCGGVFDGFVEHLEVVRLIYAIYFGPPQGAPPFVYEEPFDRMLEIISGFVRDGVTSGEFREVNVADAAWVVMGALNTILEEQLCHVPPRVDRNGLQRIVTLIVDGMVKGR